MNGSNGLTSWDSNSRPLGCECFALTIREFKPIILELNSL